MSLPWKIAVLVLLCLLGFLTFRDISFKSEISQIEVGAITNFVPSVSHCVTNFVFVTNSVVTSAEKPVLSDSYLRGVFKYHVCGSRVWVTFDGLVIRKGYPSEFGRVIVLDRFMAICVDEKGQMTYLLPADEDSNLNKRATPPPRFTSSAGGVPRDKGSRYYVHTGTTASMP